MARILRTRVQVVRCRYAPHVTPVTGTSGLAIPLGEGADDAARLRGLRRMKTLALSLLVLAALIYLLTRDRDGVLGYVNAGAEAAMVGAIADWFAVTAIFRHPMRLPIPHTAIIPKRKESLGASLQEFVAENFLREDVVRERIASTKVAARAGGWLVEGDHAQRLVDIGARVLSDGLAHVKESDVAAVVEEAIIPRMLDEELSPMAGQLLGEVVRDRAHVGAVDLMLTELHRWLSANEEEVTSLVGQRAPWWTPIWLDERVAVRIHAESVEWIAEIRDTPDHQARQAMDRWLTQLAHDLQHDPDNPGACGAAQDAVADAAEGRLDVHRHLGRAEARPRRLVAGPGRARAAACGRGAHVTRQPVDDGRGVRRSRRRGARRRRRLRGRPLRP
jgi:uncharacterized membrane-anchored protein YjiN (DUF445 family)